MHVIQYEGPAGLGIEAQLVLPPPSPPPLLPFCYTPPTTKPVLEARLKEEGAGSLRKPEEFFVSTDFFEERETVIPPDVTVAEDEDLGGMLFHVF